MRPRMHAYIERRFYNSRKRRNKYALDDQNERLALSHCLRRRKHFQSVAGSSSRGLKIGERGSGPGASPMFGADDGRKTGAPDPLSTQGGSAKAAQPGPHQPPSISLPKGGGAIHGIGEKF